MTRNSILKLVKLPSLVENYSLFINNYGGKKLPHFQIGAKTFFATKLGNVTHSKMLDLLTNSKCHILKPL